MIRRPLLRSRIPGLLAPLALALSMAWQAGAVQAASADDDRIVALSLSSGGMAQVLRRVAVEGNATVRIQVPVDQVDDLLKSLVVHDPDGSVTALVLDGLAPLQETFERLPFQPEDLRSLASLAARMPGAAVRAASGGRAVEGTILGVAQAEAMPGATEPADPLLSVLTDDAQIQTLRLGSDSVLEFKDEALRSQLHQALRVSREHRGDTVRTVEIALQGEGRREIELTYVIAAPVWKSAYRLLTEDAGKARLQAWAVLENASGQDWDGVNVTLTSGAPVMLSQRLLQRYWNERPELPVAVGASAVPRADLSAQLDVQESAAYKQADMAARPAVQSMRSMPAPAMAGAAGQAPLPYVSRTAEAAAQEGQTSVSYALPVPVTVAAGRTLSVPFVDASLDAERISVFQPDRRSLYPVAGVWLSNTTEGSLPPGILTVYDKQAGHIGDAQLAALPKGESRIVYFAEDRKVEIRTETRPQERVSEATVSQGVLKITRQLRRETTYTIKGASDEARTVMIEHPRQAGWEFQSDALVGDTAEYHRLRVTVPASGQVQVKALAQRDEAQTLQLLDADHDALLHWSGIASDSRTAERLKTLAELRRELAQAQQQESAFEEQGRRIIDNQSRLRDNLAAVPADSTLGQRYLGLLTQAEDELAEVARQAEQARQTTRQRRDALEKALGE